MKFLIFLMFLAMSVLIGSCGESIQEGAGLSENERNYLAALAAEKCMNETNDDFTKFMEDSTYNMANYPRDKAWKREHKVGTAVVEAFTFYVWKVANPFVYYRLRNGDASKNIFYKVDLTANQDMVRNLQIYKCNKKHEITGTISFQLRILGAVNPESSVQYENFYRFIDDLPTFVGVLNQHRVKRTFNVDGDVTNTETIDYKFTYDAGAAAQVSDYTTLQGREYCVPKFTAAVPPATMNVYAFPFEFDCSFTDTPAFNSAELVL